MKKIAIIFGLALMSSTVFARQLTCQLSVYDTSEVGMVENAERKLVKTQTSTVDANKDSRRGESGRSADMEMSLPSNDWHNYATLSIIASLDKAGNIADASVSDEIKNISVPLAISANKKTALITYIHGGQVASNEILEIVASCKIAQ